MSRFLHTCLAFAAVLGCSAQARAADWVRLTSGPIELLTDAGERTAREAMDRLLELQQVLPNYAAAAKEQGTPKLRVFVLESEGEFRRFTIRETSDGFFQTGLERDHIVTYASQGISRVVAHEYVHFLTGHSGIDRPAAYPHWLTEGIAEFYSNAVLSGDGDSREIVVGRPIEEHVELLKSLDAPQSAGWLEDAVLRKRPDEIAAASGMGTDGRGLATVYYAESWALVHMLNFDPRYREGLEPFHQLLETEPDEAMAFEQAFGRSLQDAIEDLPRYLDQISADRRPIAPSSIANRTAETNPIPIGEAESIHLLGRLALICQRLDTATEFFEQAAEAWPDDPQSAAGLAALAQAQGRNQEARRLIEQAISLGSEDAQAYFTLALIEQRAGAGADRVRELLEQTLQINPGFGQAHLLLGVRATDDGEYAPAIAHLEAAARLMPTASHVWHALAYAQQRGGNLEEASAAAIRAVRNAGSPVEQGMSTALLNSIKTDLQSAQ